MPIGTGTHRSCEPNPASFGALGAGVGASALALEMLAELAPPAPKASTLGEAVVIAVEGGGDGDPVLTCGFIVVTPKGEGEGAILAAFRAVGVYACFSYTITFCGFAGMSGMGTMLVAPT